MESLKMAMADSSKRPSPIKFERQELVEKDEKVEKRQTVR